MAISATRSGSSGRHSELLSLAASLSLPVKPVILLTFLIKTVKVFLRARELPLATLLIPFQPSAILCWRRRNLIGPCWRTWGSRHLSSGQWLRAYCSQAFFKTASPVRVFLTIFGALPWCSVFCSRAWGSQAREYPLTPRKDFADSRAFSHAAYASGQQVEEDRMARIVPRTVLVIQSRFSRHPVGFEDFLSQPFVAAYVFTLC